MFLHQDKGVAKAVSNARCGISLRTISATRGEKLSCLSTSSGLLVSSLRSFSSLETRYTKSRICCSSIRKCYLSIAIAQGGQKINVSCFSQFQKLIGDCMRPTHILRFIAQGGHARRRLHRGLHYTIKDTKITQSLSIITGAYFNYTR